MLLGKGIYIWHVPAVCKGVLGDIIALLRSGGFQWVAVKCAEAGSAYIAPRLKWPTWGENVTRDTVRALQAAGLRVFGWGYCYGDRPGDEGRIAASQVGRLALDGWIFDVEIEFTRQDRPGDRGERLVREFRELAPDVTAGFCYFPHFRSPETGTTWHSAKLAERMMAGLDFGSPMVYWATAGGNTAGEAVAALETSLQQWGEITDKPLIPTGQAYNTKTVTLRPEAISAFGERVRELGLFAELWWSLQHAYKVESIWTSLIGLPPWELAAPDPGTELEARILALEERSEKLIEYATDLQQQTANLVQRLDTFEAWAHGIAYSGGLQSAEREDAAWTRTS